MLKVGGWLAGGRHKAHGQSKSLNALDEVSQSECSIEES